MVKVYHSGKYLMNVYIEAGFLLAAGDMELNNMKSLLLRNLHSGRKRQKISIQCFLFPYKCYREK